MSGFLLFFRFTSRQFTSHKPTEHQTVWLEVKDQFYGIPVAGKRSSVPIPKSTLVMRLERATIIRVTIERERS